MRAGPVPSPLAEREGFAGGGPPATAAGLRPLRAALANASAFAQLRTPNGVRTPLALSRKGARKRAAPEPVPLPLAEREGFEPSRRLRA